MQAPDSLLAYYSLHPEFLRRNPGSRENIKE